MPKSNETLNSDLYDLLVSSGFDVETLDSSGKSTPVPDEAEVFQFKYINNGKDFGTVTATVDGLKNVVVYYNDQAMGGNSIQGDDDGWFGLVKKLKKFAHRRQLGFKLSNIDRLGNDMKKRAHLKKIGESAGWLEDSLMESSGSKNVFEGRVDSPVSQAITRRLLNQHISLVGKYGPQAVMDAVDQVADWVDLGPDDEIGSSDVSAWTSQVIRMLQTGAGEGLGEGAKVDRMVQHIEKSEKKAGKSEKEAENIAWATANKLGMLDNKNKKKVAEGYYGTKQTSYSDTMPETVKMIIKHNKALAETDQRFRHIAKIFLETDSGARFLVPSNKPSIARSFARHIAEGGEYNDERWNHIKQLSEDITKLGGFVRATRSKQFNECVTRMVSEATAQYKNLRETMKRIQSSRGYNSYFESWTPTLLEASDDNLAAVFTNSSLDPRIESALPVLSRMNIRLQEIAEADAFEGWADKIIDEAVFGDLAENVAPVLRGQRDELIELLSDDSEPLLLGPDAMSAINKLATMGIEEDSLNERMRKIAKNDPDTDAKTIVRLWMQENADDAVYGDIVDELGHVEAAEVPKQAPQKPVAKPQPKKPEPKKPAKKEEPESVEDIPPPPLAEDELTSLKRLLRK